MEGNFYRVEELDKGMFYIQIKMEDSVGHQTLRNFKLKEYLLLEFYV